MLPAMYHTVVHIVVMGSGGVGAYFGAKLHRAGERVTFVARGPHLAAIKRSGLAIKSAVEGDVLVRPAAVERLEGVDRADAVLFCVKSFDTDDAAARLWSVLGPETPVLSLQNGVDNEDKIDAKLGAGRAMGGVAQVFATIELPGVIRHHAAGRIIFGEMDGTVSARAQRLRDAFARAEVPVEVSKSIRRALWEKYLLICAVGGTTAVTRETLGAVRDTPASWRLFRTIVEEVAALARASGVDLPDDAVDQVVKFAATIPPGNRASLAQDLLQGRRLELEALHGHAARLGERLGVPTPAIFAVYAALAPHAAGRRG
jgi:2-dehydropantoate 2-reductase